jgi:hypothetical protein
MNLSMLNAINVLSREVTRLEGNAENQQADIRERSIELDRCRAGLAKIENDIYELRVAIAILQKGEEKSVAAAG